MADQFAELTHRLFCLNCKKEEAQFALKGDAFVCENCAYIYPVVDQIVIAFSEEGKKLGWEDDWAGEKKGNVLAMKEYAYFSDGFIPRMYQHYHRFVADRRKKMNFTECFIDIGCGFGEHSKFIGKEEKEYYIGVDVDKYKLKSFRDREPDVCLVQCDAKELPFKKSCCSFVQTTAFLEHFDRSDISKILNEIKRVLKEKGNYINCVPTEGGALLALGQWFMQVYFKMRFDMKLQHEEQHKSDTKDILKLIRNEFLLLESYYFPFWVHSIDLNLFVNELYMRE